MILGPLSYNYINSCTIFLPLVQFTYSWKGEVVYGDTDSVFVLLRGRSKEEAFQIGEDIASYITGRSPPDVVLKMEKVLYDMLYFHL